MGYGETFQVTTRHSLNPPSLERHHVPRDKRLSEEKHQPPEKIRKYVLEHEQICNDKGGGGVQ